MKRKKDDLDRTIEKILKEDPSFAEGLEKADEAWDIAFQVYDLRKKSGAYPDPTCKTCRHETIQYC